MDWIGRKGTAMRSRHLILIIAMTITALAGCGGGVQTPIIAPTSQLTPTPAVAPTADPSQPLSTPETAPLFAHMPCAKGVDLTGQIVSFYHMADGSDPESIPVQSLKAGYDDAAAYFNAHGGLCGATLAQVIPEFAQGQYNPQVEYSRLAALNPKPLVIALYNSSDAELLRDQLAKDQIVALGAVGSVLGLYGANGQTPGWIFATNPSYPDQLGAFCRYISQHPQQYPNPVIGYLTWVVTLTLKAYTPESIAYCASLDVKVLDTPAYFNPETTVINDRIQNLIDAGANILYTDSLGTGPALIAKTAVGMGLQNAVTLAGTNWALDTVVGLLGQTTPGANGLPATNGLLGSLPLRAWAERDQPGIQLIAEQADLHQRPLAERDNLYILGWTNTDLFIEVYIQTGNRVGFDHISGAEIKRTLESIVYSPLGGIETIDYHGGTRRALDTDRIGQLAYLGRDGKTPAGPNNQPLLVFEGGQHLMVPMLVPLTDFQPAPDLRPGSADVPSLLAPTPTNSPNATASPSGRLVVTGTLAFVSYRDGNLEIYVTNADGSGLKRLTNNPAADDAPAWSPDGQKITFRTDRDGNLEIYVMNADGSGQINLTNNPAADEQPAWSPDGTQIAFSSDRDGNHEIYVMNTDGSHVTRLTHNPAFDELPSWSPDGKQIAFVTDRDGNGEIYVMQADGTHPRRLTNNSTDDAFPHWSPDGKKILFWSARDGNAEVYVMNGDGSGQTNLTNNPADDGPTGWSPDGKYIGFGSNRAGSGQAYVMNADGSNQTLLIADSTYSGEVVWRP